ncbi:MAG TPA: hypothetical protein VD994_00930 [Prosthecobacter sp.]|nr:hypothetical protein [Prosthecobacter sp.]
MNLLPRITGDPATFIRCWNHATKSEIKLYVKCRFPNEAAVRSYLTRFFRHLEYKEHSPWSDAEHSRGPLYPVPIQNILFDPPKQIIEPPAPVRRSVLVRPSLLNKSSILKGV